MRCEICGNIDRGGVAHQYCREFAAFRRLNPGYTPLHERSAIGVALRRRGYDVRTGPGTYVSTIGLAFITQCSWVHQRTLRRWENGEIS